MKFHSLPLCLRDNRTHCKYHYVSVFWGLGELILYIHVNTLCFSLLSSPLVKKNLISIEYFNAGLGGKALYKTNQRMS